MGKHPFFEALPEEVSSDAGEQNVETTPVVDARPDIEGYDGSLTMTPSMVAEAQRLPAATEEEFICLAPCKHYQELAMKPPADDETSCLDREDLHRICMFFHDDEGEMSLTNAGMHMCSAFVPNTGDVDKNTKLRLLNESRRQEIRQRFLERAARRAGSEEE